MTVHYTLKQVPAKEEKYHDFTQCDLCGARTNNWDWPNPTSKADCAYAETAVSMEVGSRYPDMGDYTKTSYHICPDCFTAKLMPWFKAQGAEPTIEEVEW